MRRTQNGVQYLEFGTAHPANGGQFVMLQEMIGFVVESPLADRERRAAVLDLLDHRLKRLSLVFAQLLEVFRRLDVQLMLGLWLRGLERTGQDRNLHVLQLL